MFLNIKTKILSALERNGLKIIRLFLWFHRIIGFTFGGLVIDSNGKLSANKYYKYYGYSLWVLTVLLDWFQIIYFIFNFTNTNKSTGFENMSKMTILLSYSVVVVWGVLRHAIQFHFNAYGFELAQMLAASLKHQAHSLVNFWSIIHIASWLFGSLATFIILPLSFRPTYNLQYVTIIEYNLALFYFWALTVVTWVISNSYTIRLDNIKDNLKTLIRERSIRTVGYKNTWLNQNPQNKQILHYKKEFIEMRDRINELDTHLADILVIRSAVTIYSIMINVYLLVILSESAPAQLELYRNILGTYTEVSIAEALLSSFHCGRVHQKSEQIYGILDAFNANEMSDNELKDWLMFKSVSNKTPFGFTIGGFAPIRKGTVISIFTFVLNYTIILLQTDK